MTPDIGTDPGPAASIEAIVLDILADALDESVDNLRRQRVLAAYGWDSMTTLVTLAQLESRFGITVDLRAYHATRTVDDLVSLVSGDPATNLENPLMKEHR